MHFSFGSSKSRHLICWVLENSFFGPAVCLAITIPLSKKVNKRQKKLALACLTYETPSELLDRVGLGAIYVNACNFHNKQVHKEVHSVQVITEPQSSRNFLLEI